MNVTGRWALVTAGHVRIGRSIALRLARAYMNIIVTYGRNAQAADATVSDIQALGVKAHALPVDLADADSTDKLAREAQAVAAQDGGIVVLVNNASVYQATPLAQTSAATWDTILSVNVRAPFLLARMLGPLMKAAGAGKIINIGDWAGLRPYAGYAPYMVSKAGLIHLTRALALELAPEVQVNCVCPGPVLLPTDFGPQLAEAIEHATPLKRTGSPEDVAAAVEFFVTGTDFATGSILTVDGGRWLGHPSLEEIDAPQG